MEISYEKISQANEKLKYTAIHGKNYAEVPQRVQAFRKVIPSGFILPEIISMTDDIVYMKATAGYYAEDGRQVVLAVGHAYERRDASNINKTSFIENCETSAVGRALGFIGIGSETSIASAEEVDNAIKTQNAIENGTIPEKPAQKVQKSTQAAQNAQQPATVEKAATLPQTEPKNTNPVLEYLAKERQNLQNARGISKGENAALWAKQVEVLKGAKLVPDKALSSYTKQEAETLVQFMCKRL